MQVLYIYIYIYASRNVLGFKEKINVELREGEKNLPWGLCSGTTGGREDTAP